MICVQKKLYKSELNYKFVCKSCLKAKVTNFNFNLNQFYLRQPNIKTNFKLPNSIMGPLKVKPNIHEFVFFKSYTLFFRIMACLR